MAAPRKTTARKTTARRTPARKPSTAVEPVQDTEPENTEAMESVDDLATVVADAQQAMWAWQPRLVSETTVSPDGHVTVRRYERI